MRAALPLVLLAALLPAAAAQTVIQPVVGAYEDIYLVAGRAIDARGEPVAGAELAITLDQEGVRAEPLRATTNCKGDFITYFNLRDVSPRGSVTVTVRGREGVADASAKAAFDPFYRRSDLVVRLEGSWDYRCEAKDDVWPVAVSVTGRILNRTDPWEAKGVTYHARPYEGPVRLRYEDANGTVNCPPAANAPPGACDFLRVDERGDFRYTFTYDRPIPADGRMHLVFEGQTRTVPVDPATRLAVLHLEATGRGAPSYDADAPLPAPLLALLLAAAAGLALRRPAPPRT